MKSKDNMQQFRHWRIKLDARALINADIKIQQAAREIAEDDIAETVDA